MRPQLFIHLRIKRGSSPTLSMREKSLLKRRVNKEHNSNFRAGYVHINEEQLHKTGIRGRKMYFVYAAVALLTLTVIVNVLITSVVLYVLGIGREGMAALEFIPRGRLVRFLQDSDMGDVILTEPEIGSLPDQHIELSGEEEGKVELRVTGPFGPSVTLDEDKTVLRSLDGVTIQDPDTGSIVFSTDPAQHRNPQSMANINTEKVTTNRVTSDTKHRLLLEGRQQMTVTGGSGVSIGGREVHFYAEKDIHIYTGEELIVNGQESIKLNFYKDLPIKNESAPTRADVETYKLCVRSDDSSLYTVPWDGSCHTVS